MIRLPNIISFIAWQHCGHVTLSASPPSTSKKIKNGRTFGNTTPKFKTDLRRNPTEQRCWTVPRSYRKNKIFVRKFLRATTNCINLLRSILLLEKFSLRHQIACKLMLRPRKRCAPHVAWSFWKEKLFHGTKKS